MLGLALLTPSRRVATEVGQLAQNSTLFKLNFQATPIPAIHEVIRALRIHDLDVVLLDLTDWDAVASLVAHVKQTNIPAVIVGFRPEWNRLEQITFEEAGIRELLHEPFTLSSLEVKAYEALHRERPVSSQNLVAFLPAKAGGGCSTVALHTAAAVAGMDKKVLLIESDRRSGVLGIMLNQNNRTGLSDVLQLAGALTPGEWTQHCVQVAGMDLLLANPARPGPLPAWSDYYQLLRFIQSRYGFVAVDMPELVNSATAEVVRAARSVCIVCTADVPSLMMATQRRAEIAACDYPKENIHVVLNRWEKGGLSLSDVEKVLGQPIMASLPDDYKGLKKALLKSRLIAPSSAFFRSCFQLGRKLTGLPDAEPWPFKASFLKHFGKNAE
jgi:MinD-like ATPase involved in chromosome partitioning or flagellar assembly